MCMHVRTNVCSVRLAHKSFTSSLPEKLCVPGLLQLHTSVCVQSQAYKTCNMMHLIPYSMYKMLKLNGLFQHLMYHADSDLLGKYIRTIKQNAEALLVSSKGIGVEVNAEKLKLSH